MDDEEPLDGPAPPVPIDDSLATAARIQAGLDAAARRRRRWHTFGGVVLGLFVAGGLALVAFIGLVLLALNDWSSNK